MWLAQDDAQYLPPPICNLPCQRCVLDSKEPMKPKESVSRKPIVLLASLCLIVSAVAIPVAAKLPRLVEVELVMGVWWLIWVGILTYLLHRGHEVEDDADWSGKWGSDSSVYSWIDQIAGRHGGSANYLSGCDPSGCFLDEGCGYFAVGIFAIILFGLAFFLVIELLIPAIALLLLASIGGMFARAVNDTHHCEGRIGLSMLWGAAWATVYVGPVAAIAIWVAAYLAKRS